MIEIGTREADGPLLALQRDPRMAAKPFTAFAALGVAMCDEDPYVIHGKVPPSFQFGMESRAARGAATLGRRQGVRRKWRGLHAVSTAPTGSEELKCRTKEIKQ